MKEKEMSEKEEEIIEEEVSKEEEIEELSLEEQLKESGNKYLLLLAEMENTRKRMQKEKNEALLFAIENTISEFLPIIDNFENALNFADKAEGEVKNWSMGFQMILSQLKEVLHNHGVVAFHSKGNMFDPHYHEAMEIVETNDYPDGSIIEELAKGYKSANRTIRPARVKVAKKIEEKLVEDTKENEETEEELIKEDK